MDAAGFQRRNSAVEVLADGRWAIAADPGEVLRWTREEVRQRIAERQKRAALYSTPAENEQRQADWEKWRAAHGAELASLSRALIIAFPGRPPPGRRAPQRGRASHQDLRRRPRCAHSSPATTSALLVQGSCGISALFGDPKKLSYYLTNDDLTRLRRRIEADIESLYALYEYGRLHGVVRLRWGFLKRPGSST